VRSWTTRSLLGARAGRDPLGTVPLIGGRVQRVPSSVPWRDHLGGPKSVPVQIRALDGVSTTAVLAVEERPGPPGEAIAIARALDPSDLDSSFMRIPGDIGLTAATTHSGRPLAGGFGGGSSSLTLRLRGEHHSLEHFDCLFEVPEHVFPGHPDLIGVRGATGPPRFACT